MMNKNYLLLSTDFYSLKEKEVLQNEWQVVTAKIQLGAHVKIFFKINYSQ